MASNRVRTLGPEAGRIAQARPGVLTHLVAFARRKPLGALSAGVILLLALGAICANFLPYGPFDTELGDRLLSPSWKHLLGTDELGRDLLTRIVYGSRITLKIGFLAVLLGVAAGSVLGLISGYFGGIGDILIQRAVDALMSFPALVLALALASIRQPSDTNTLVIIGIVLIPTCTRVVRGATMAVKPNVYVEAARALGAGNMRILMRHILPNVTAPIIVVASVFIGSAIIVESSLSFLGVGSPPPSPSWGAMLSGSGRKSLETHWWLALFPSLALAAAVYSFNLLGDAVRDILDPRLRGGIGRMGR